MDFLIVLAAGNSRRFGSNKLLCSVCGEPLYRRALHTLWAVSRAAPGRQLMVVSQTPQILDEAERLGAAAIESPDSVRGMSYSIKAALRQVGAPKNGDRLLFAAADQPYLSARTVEALLAQPEETLAACAAWGETPGNPVLFDASLVPALWALHGDEGGRKALLRTGTPCRLVQVSHPRELLDIDTPADAQEQMTEQAKKGAQGV